MAKVHAETIEMMVQRLQTNLESGLSQSEAEKRLVQYGNNQLQEALSEPAWKKFAAQFKGLIIGLLIFAAILAGFLGEWVDTIAILAIVFLNAILGFVQEERAEKALAALRNMAAPQAKAIRDGALRLLPAIELVPGDLIELEAGDNVPSDARLITAFGLQAQEASLTGESAPVMKEWNCEVAEDTALGDRRNMVFAGTTVVAGKGRAIIASTGMETEIGAIAGLLRQSAQGQTPMQRRLQELGRVLVTGCMVIVTIIFAMQIYRGEKLVEAFLTSVSLAVAAVPEGLPAVVTVTLAIGLQRMAAKNALIRNLPSVETLGCVDVICTDKTGTLTRNEMTVRQLWVSRNRWQVSGEGFSPAGDVQWTGESASLPSAGEQPSDQSTHAEILKQDLALLTRIAANCNTAQWSWKSEENRAISIGDPTEIALLVAASKVNKAQTLAKSKPLHEIPFDSDRKMMSQVYRWSDSEILMLAKGAPEVIVGRCSKIREFGVDRPMTSEDGKAIEEENNWLANQALRVLGLAYRTVQDNPDDWKVESDFTFVGLVGMMDPPRAEAKEAVARCKEAGIRPVMITGDHPQTALAIGRALSIVDNNSSVVTGVELDQTNAEQLKKSVTEFSIFARVSAEHKLKIVDALRSRGHVVAMTGDGVNDAPAVKKADIGIVMGITGTDVAKEAADMVLTDDNFVSIVNAVEEGRGIYENIQKFLHFLLACNISEVLFMFIAVLVAWPSPLLPIQILWINLVTDGIPALALALEPIEKHLMSRKPRSLNEPVLPLWRVGLILMHGFLMAAVALFAYAWVRSQPGAKAIDATTIAFCTITLSQVFFSIGCRSFSKTMPQVGAFTNPTLLVAIGATVAIQIAVVTWPWSAHILQVRPMSLAEWGMVIGLALVPVTLVELAKLLFLGPLKGLLNFTTAVATK